MKSRRLLVFVIFLGATAFVGIVPASASPSNSWLPDGYYGATSFATSAEVGITVSDNGTRALWQTPAGVSCIPSPSLVAADPNQVFATSPVVAHLPPLVITPSGTFAFNGKVTVTSEYVALSVSPLSLEIRGHFVKGDAFNDVPATAVGTFSAPQICAASDRKTFSLKG